MLQTFFNADILKQAWPIILAGLGNTVLLSLVVVPLGLFGGLILAMLASVRKPWVRWPLMAWVDFFRAFPPLVLLIFFYAGLPFVGLQLGGFACAWLPLFLNTGAYPVEIRRRRAPTPPPPATRGPPAAPPSAASRPCSKSSCRRPCATSSRISSPTPSKWSSSPRWAASLRCPDRKSVV